MASNGLSPDQGRCFVQTVSKGYPQTAKVAASKEIASLSCENVFLPACLEII